MIPFGVGGDVHCCMLLIPMKHSQKIHGYRKTSDTKDAIGMNRRLIFITHKTSSA